MLNFIEKIIDKILSISGNVIVVIMFVLSFIMSYFWVLALIALMIFVLITFPVIGVPVAVIIGLFLIKCILEDRREKKYYNEQKQKIIEILKEEPELLNHKGNCIKIIYEKVGDMQPEDLRSKREEDNEKYSIKQITKIIEEIKDSHLK